MEFYNKHFIRLNTNNYIIKGFSDAFEPPLDNDICVNQEGGRHFELLGNVNPPLIDLNGCHLYKYVDGVVTETREEERKAELASLPKVIVSDQQAEYLIELDYRMSKLELGV